MQPEELKQAIQKIKMWQRNGERAPHKPLLILYALGRLARGEPQQMSYEQVKDDLKNLLIDFGQYRKNYSPSYTFVHLWGVENHVETIDTKQFATFESSGFK